MKFGPVPPRDALGGVTVHSIRNSGLVLKKGVTIGEKEIAALEQAGVSEIVVARIELSDVSEDEAAATIAQASAGEGVYVDKAFTGRANLFAREAGVLVVDKAAINRLNMVDEAITLATLPAFKPIVSGEMIATVKIIPFAVARAAQDAALAIARAATPLVRIAPYRVRKVGVVSTLLPGLADKVVDKTLRIMADRLRPTGASIIEQQRVAHKTDALAPAIQRMLEQGAELVVVFGASAIADRRDVIPAAIEAIGGKVDHFGMPVDPGNLLLMGRAGNVPVLGAPGCARSPKENGFDWVLSRLLADLPVTRNDVAQMGVGGLLMEIVTRPQPRAGGAEGDKVAGLLLAAGRGTRMGGPNKLLAEIGGKPLVRIVAEHILASRAHPLIVVTGHERARVEQTLRGLDVTFVHNPNYGDGLSTSLKAGLAAMPDDVAGAIVCLGDMPRVSAPLIDSLIDKFNPEGGAHVVVPTLDGKRGNPVLWSRRFFADLMRLEGDVGARHVIGENDEALIEVAVQDRGVFFDVDTPEALALARDLKLSDA